MVSGGVRWIYKRYSTVESRGREKEEVGGEAAVEGWIEGGVWEGREEGKWHREEKLEEECKRRQDRNVEGGNGGKGHRRFKDVKGKWKKNWSMVV